MNGASRMAGSAASRFCSASGSTPGHRSWRWRSGRVQENTLGYFLKPNGLLVMGVADATTPEGYQKLMRDVPSYFSKQGAGAFGQFEWMSAELAVKVLEKMGFVVELVPEASTRDCYFVATKGRTS